MLRGSKVFIETHMSRGWQCKWEMLNAPSCRNMSIMVYEHYSSQFCLYMSEKGGKYMYTHDMFWTHGHIQVLYICHTNQVLSTCLASVQKFCTWHICQVVYTFLVHLHLPSYNLDLIFQYWKSCNKISNKRYISL